MRLCFVLLLVLLFPAVARADLRTAHVRGVPHVRQKPDFCGEACVAMALQKHGRRGDQDFVFDESGLDPVLARGCHTKELAVAAKKVGFDIGPVWHRVKANDARSLDRLLEQINNDLRVGHTSLVCMHYDDKPNTTEHFRLITGFDAERDEVVYQEPAIANGGNKRMSRATFLKLWPLKYKRDEWTVILMRMRPTRALRGVASPTFTNADYTQHIMRLRKRLPNENFHIVVQKPFVVVGDETLQTVQRRSVGTVKWAVDRIRRDYFKQDPNEILDVWLFRDRASYNTNAKKLFGKTPSTPYGYYSSTDKALVMNISTGGGTLVHEIVHPFMESNFPECPAWFNEGLASLYEQSRDQNGHIRGSTNWRLRGLQSAIADGTVPPFKTLCETTTHEFYQEDPGTNYSQARYLCYYLQEQGLLVKYYHEFHRNAKSDPTGYETLKAVLGVRDMAEFKTKWEAYVGGLRF